ncbi:transport protein 3 [Furfurilactobacillus rossiae]|uniref:MFS transporter n=1 Tax=Furfurilactobacillus rossiae TaxID=231049 RepID=UPI0015BD27B8|nr:MFS transporter [Furfurilactobacillus rossiae]QLE64307.1 transport protein 3 [Furfurilactobacillus rossiae]
MATKLRLNRIMIMAFLVNAIYSMIWPVSTLYMHDAFDLSLPLIGVVLMCYSLANAAGSVISGYLFDRMSHQKILMSGFYLLLTVSFIGMFGDGLVAFILFLVPFGFITGWCLTVQYALVSDLQITNSENDSRKNFNLLYLAVNLGIVAGSGSLGLLYRNNEIKTLMATVTVIALFVTLIGLGTGQHNVVENVSRVSVQEPNSQVGTVLKRDLIIRIFITLFLFWIVYVQWMTNFSVYFTSLGYSAGFYSHVWVINGIGITLIQVFLLRFAHFFKTSIVQSRFGIFFLVLSFGCLIASTNKLWLLVAAVFLTIGEALFVPAAPVVVDQNSSVVVKGRNQGLVNVFSSIGKAVGPGLGGVVIVNGGYQKLFLLAILLLLVSEILLLNFKRK